MSTEVPGGPEQKETKRNPIEDLQSEIAQHVYTIERQRLTLDEITTLATALPSQISTEEMKQRLEAIGSIAARKHSQG